MLKITQKETELIQDMTSFCEEHYDAFLKSCNEDVEEFNENLFNNLISKVYNSKQDK